MADTCETCKFYTVLKRKGFCKRFPPQVTATGGEIIVPGSFHPVVEPGDWCGEHQPKEED